MNTDSWEAEASQRSLACGGDQALPGSQSFPGAQSARGSVQAAQTAFPALGLVSQLPSLAQGSHIASSPPPLLQGATLSSHVAQ